MEVLQLSVCVREVYFPFSSSQSCVVHLNLLGQSLKLKAPYVPVTVQSPEVLTGNTGITIQLYVAGAKQAEADFLLKEFFLETLKGESENWVLLNDTQDAGEKRVEYTQVKLWMSLQTVSKPKAPAKRAAARSLSSGGLGLLPQMCPFLSKIENTARQDRECELHTAIEILGSLRKEIKRLMTQNAPESELKTYLQVPIESEMMDSLDVEVPKMQVEAGRSLSPEKQEYLKALLCGLAEKFKAIKSTEDEVAHIREANELLIQGRRDLEESLNDTTQQLRSDGVKADKHFARINEERNQIALNFEKQTAICRELETEIERLKKQIALLQRDLTAQKAKDIETSYECRRNLQEEIAGLKGRLQDSESRRSSLQTIYGKTCDTLRIEAKRHSDALSDWKTERESLLATIRSKDSEIEGLQAEMEGLKAEILHIKEERKLQSDLESQVLELRIDAEEREKREEALRRQLKELMADINAHKSDLEKRTSAYISDKQRLNEQLSQCGKALETKTHEHLEAKRQLFDSRNSVTTLEQLCCNKEDLHQLHEEALSQVRAYQESKDFLIRELVSLSEYLLSQSQARLDITQAANVLSERMTAKEDEIDQLKEVIAKLKKRMAVYVPVRDDPVDCALADYLNNRDLPLLIPFKREQPEIYNFGSKRIFVKLENGRIVIRVGGGFMTIEEFIEVYTPLEMEKVDKVMNKTVSPDDRRAMGKLVSAVVSCASEDSSPRKKLALGEKSGFTALLGLRKSSNSPSKSGGTSSPEVLRHSTTFSL